MELILQELEVSGPRNFSKNLGKTNKLINFSISGNTYRLLTKCEVKMDIGQVLFSRVYGSGQSTSS